jgi:sugar phosphate isomerase/epimerase
MSDRNSRIASLRPTLSRRELLAGAGIAALSAAEPWRMRLSTSSVHFHTLPVEEACARIAALGFEAVDFWPARFKCPHLDQIADRLGASGLRELLARHKLALCGFTCYLTSPYSRYAEILGKAGGGVLIREARYGKVTDLNAQMRDLMEGLKPELEAAERFGYHIAVENHSGSILNSLDSWKAFLDLARHPRLGIALAPFHLQRERIPVEDVIALAGKRILFFYAWQNEPGKNQLPGAGPADFTPWLKALAAAGYTGYVNPFMHGEVEPDEMSPALAGARRYLLDCRGKF